MRQKAAFFASALLGASFFVGNDANAHGPILLNAAEMDAVTAAGVSAPTAATLAMADATGDFTMTSTDANAWVRGIQPVGLPSAAASYVTVTSGTSTAGGVGHDSSVSTSVDSTNEQPFPDNAVVGASINKTVRGLSSSITIRSEMKFGGLLFSRLSHLMSRYR